MSHDPDRNTRNKIQILYFVLDRHDLKHLKGRFGGKIRIPGPERPAHARLPRPSRLIEAWSEATEEALEEDIFQYGPERRLRNRATLDRAQQGVPRGPQRLHQARSLDRDSRRSRGRLRWPQRSRPQLRLLAPRARFGMGWSRFPPALQRPSPRVRSCTRAGT